MHFESTQAHIVRLFIVLSSHSLDCISCSHEEMCDAPIGTISWSPAKKWNGLKKLMYSGGGEGVWSHLCGQVFPRHRETRYRSIVAEGREIHFWIREVFPFMIHLGKLVSLKYYLIFRAIKLWMDVNFSN